MVTENGMGVQDEEQFMDKDGMVQDDYRITFIKDHLKCCTGQYRKDAPALAIICGAPSTAGPGPTHTKTGMA